MAVKRVVGDCDGGTSTLDRTVVCVLR